MDDDVMRASEPALALSPLEPIDVSRHHGTGPFMRSDITTARGRSSEGPGPRTASGRGATDFQERLPEKQRRPSIFSRTERQHPARQAEAARATRTALNFRGRSVRRAEPDRAPLAVPMNRDVGLDIQTGGLVFVEFHRP
jgi:hypothetical protein